DKFDLENNFNCTYDFLEIRDGGHGFDRLIGRYCGTTFPPMIVSTTRYLWLRFVSDDTIEGAGAFEPPECKINVTGYEGWVNNTDIAEGYLKETLQLNKPVDCMWVVNVTEGWKVRTINHYLFCISGSKTEVT
ncbi:Neuropilin and tolloid-like protein 2, partial [Blattella germanica]